MKKTNDYLPPVVEVIRLESFEVICASTVSDTGIQCWELEEEDF